MRGERSKTSFGPNCRRVTNMLTTVRAALGLPTRIRSMCPSCKLPIVGTNTLLGSRCSRSRNAVTEVTMSMLFAQVKELALSAHALDAQKQPAEIGGPVDEVEPLGVDDQHRHAGVVVEKPVV